MQNSTAYRSASGEIPRRISLYSAAAVGGVAGTLSTFESAQANLVITPSSITLTNHVSSAPGIALDLNGDSTPDVGVLVFSSSFASAQGVNGASLAGTVGAGGFFYPTAFQPGGSVGSGLTFSANSGGAPNTFGTLANSAGGGGPAVGNWLSGGDAYLGVKFTVGANDHFGWVHVVWDPTLDALTIDQFAFEDTANGAALVPEPSSLTFLALGAVGLLRRRRRGGV